jgi:hypothetical protein
MATPLDNEAVFDLVEDLIGEELHARQARSVAHSVLGALYADRAGVAAIGRAAAQKREVKAKHSIKQVDRLLSNHKIDVPRVQGRLVRRLVGKRKDIIVSIDWTEFAPDGHSTVVISLVTNHGRATPLVWKTVKSTTLLGRRNGYEDTVLKRLAAALPDEVHVTALGDRGFADCGLYALLSFELGFDFVIRFKAGVVVEASHGEVRTARDWVPSNGRARRLDSARVTRGRRVVAAVVFVKRAGMKDSWCLATSREDDAEDIINLYSRRFDIEHNFRDQKDRRFGFGLYYAKVGSPARRDMLVLIIVLATFIATVLGAAGESIGLDRDLRANTVRSRTHSLWRQGREYIGGVTRDAIDQLRQTFYALWRGLESTTRIYATL